MERGLYIIDYVACGTPLAKVALCCHFCEIKAEVGCLKCDKNLVKEAMFCAFF